MSNRNRRRGGPPAWFIFLVGFGIVFGIYIAWTQAREFVATGIQVVRATEESVVQITATVEQMSTITANAPTPRPSSTPIPTCQEFKVSVDSAILRDAPTTNAGIAGVVDFDESVCVIGRSPENAEWYIVDTNILTRRLEPAYMREDLIYAVNPTPTPSDTPTPAPTITPSPSLTPSNTLDVTITPTRRANITNTPTITPTYTPTNPVINL